MKSIKIIIIAFFVGLIVGIFFCTEVGSALANTEKPGYEMRESVIDLYLSDRCERGVRADREGEILLEYSLVSRGEYDRADLSFKSSDNISFVSKNRTSYEYSPQERSITIGFFANANAELGKNASIDNAIAGEIELSIKVYRGDKKIQEKTWNHFLYITPYGSFFAPNELTEAKILYYQYLKEQAVISPQEFKLLNDALYLAAKEGSGTPDMASAKRDGIFSTTEVSLLYTATVSGDSVAIAGTVTWSDVYGNTHPARQVNVKILAPVEGNSEVTRANLETDASGAFSVSGLNANDLLYFRVYAATRDGFGVRPLIGMDYCFVTTPYLFSVTEERYASISGTAAAKAFYIHQAIIVGRAYSASMNYSNTPTVTFPRSETQYDPVLDTIWILAEDYCNFDDILHEYGHYIMDKLNFANPVGGAHSSNDILSDTRQNKEIGIKLAWNEGWATYFSVEAQLQQGIVAWSVPYAGDMSYDQIT